MPNLNNITKYYFSKTTPFDINSGECFVWAWKAKLQYKKAKLYSVSYGGGHAIIKIGKLYFDAEHPKGVKDWRRMKAFIGRQPKENWLEEMSSYKFKKYWSMHGAGSFSRKRD